MSTSQETSTVKAQLGLFDAISIIVGIVIGASIFKVPWLILGQANDEWSGLLVWVVGGVLALVGALCYAELATTYPRSGGDYEYLNKSFGGGVAFLFGWAQLVVVLPASIGTMAFVFAENATKFQDLTKLYDAPLGLSSDFQYAVLSVVIVSLLNILGVPLGKWAQNLLTLAKIIGLGGIIAAGFVLFFRNENAPTWPEPSFDKLGWGGLSIILVMYAYGGWNDAAFVAAEVRNRKRNIPGALIIGVAIITIVYVLVNLAYLLGLGFARAKEFPGPGMTLPSILLGEAFGDEGAKAITVIIMVSALGAVNGLIFAGSRVYATLGADHRLFGPLGHWSRLLGTPVLALLLQMLICVGLMWVITSKEGHDYINQALIQARLVEQAQEWDPNGGFDSLFSHAAPVFWIFFLLTGLALFKLREKYPNRERPFSVPLYPVLPIIFCCTCVYMLYQAIKYVEWRSLVCIVFVLLGVPLFWLSRALGKPASAGQGYGEAEAG